MRLPFRHTGWNFDLQVTAWFWVNIGVARIRWVQAVATPRKARSNPYRKVLDFRKRRVRGGCD